MKVAILAWGSLIWAPRDLEIAGSFELIGPYLPIEFCRVSADGRLTLVIDESLGASCITYSVLSAFDDLNRALENLWVREGTQGERLPKNVRRHGRIGFVDLLYGNQSESALKRHPKAVADIRRWAQANSCDAVIWTALASNFHEPDKAGEPFSVVSALRYLEMLEAAKLEAALNYIRRAPADAQTPVRAAVNKRWPEG